MTAEKQLKVVVPRDLSMVEILGYRDNFLNLIESRFNSDILVRGNEITIKGDPEEVEALDSLFRELLNVISAGKSLNAQLVNHMIDVVLDGGEISPSEVFSDTILIHRGKPIGPRTVGQKRYVDAIRKHTVTFAIGPAGTGKTYLAMAMSVRALKDKEVGRIILTRPAVEAGEKLGYLPGTLQEKVDPYLRPLFDALYDMMEAEQLQQLLERGTIEVAPLAYMRGRTLNDSFIILDEAQNTSPEQLKMFLTRLGFGSKMVITGDVTQIDLPNGQSSGLLAIEGILKGIGGIAFEQLHARDVVRHSLVQSIVEAYKRHEERSAGNE